MSSPEAEPRPRLVSVGLVVAGMLVAALLAGGNAAAADFVCAWDTSYCAKSTEKNGTYEGTMTLGGVPYEGPFTVDFTSRDEGDPVEFSTDEEGRYCVQWAEEAITPFVQVPSGNSAATPLLLEPKDPAIDAEPRASLIDWTELKGDAPAGCQKGDGGIPWNKAEDNSSSWQFILLLALPALAVLLLGLALGRRDASTGPRLAAAGYVVLGASFVATIVLWAL